MPPDLWARFEAPEGFLSGEPSVYGERFHLLTEPLSEQIDIFVLIGCQEAKAEALYGYGNEPNYPELSWMVEMSATVEHRKKCPACYDYWMKRRAEQQDRIERSLQ